MIGVVNLEPPCGVWTSARTGLLAGDGDSAPFLEIYENGTVDAYGEGLRGYDAWYSINNNVEPDCSGRNRSDSHRLVQ